MEEKRREIEEKYHVIECNEGHIKPHSRPGQRKNPFWKVLENGIEVIFMYCEKTLL